MKSCFLTAPKFRQERNEIRALISTTRRYGSAEYLNWNRGRNTAKSCNAGQNGEKVGEREL